MSAGAGQRCKIATHGPTRCSFLRFARPGSIAGLRVRPEGLNAKTSFFTRRLKPPRKQAFDHAGVVVRVNCQPLRPSRAGFVPSSKTASLSRWIWMHWDWRLE